MGSPGPERVYCQSDGSIRICTIVFRLYCEFAFDLVFYQIANRSFRLFLNHGVIIKTPGLEMPVTNPAAFFADITSHGRQCINGPDIDATILSAVKRLFSASTAVRVARFVEYKQKLLPLTNS